jgi:HTH-type transcriptional repressor of NAD biosynthesis genes
MSPTTAGTSGAARPVRRLCLLGGESAGKTTLAQALAERLGMPWVPEYGRELWLRVGGTFGPELLEDVAREQVRREDAAQAQAREAALRLGRPDQAWIVCDTSPLTTLVYCLIDHGQAPAALVELAARPYDLTVLCALDFAFVQDGARRDAGFSARQQALTVERLRALGRPWVQAHGPLSVRLETVLARLPGLAQARAA